MIFARVRTPEVGIPPSLVGWSTFCSDGAAAAEAALARTSASSSISSTEGRENGNLCGNGARERRHRSAVLARACEDLLDNVLKRDDPDSRSPPLGRLAHGDGLPCGRWVVRHKRHMARARLELVDQFEERVAWRWEGSWWAANGKGGSMQSFPNDARSAPGETHTGLYSRTSRTGFRSDGESIN